MFHLIDLPYEPEDLTPVISIQALAFHHGKHLQAYVDNLNKLLPGRYAGHYDYYLDYQNRREVSRAALREFLLNENNVALISPRRLGKTDLIWHVFDDEEISRDYHCFVVDIYATKSLSDFVNMLGKAVMDALSGIFPKMWML